MARNNAAADSAAAEDDLGLDLQFLSGNATSFEAGMDTEDCTSDGCGTTPFAGEA